jgi:apolipoprotein N-acyltransferase
VWPETVLRIYLPQDTVYRRRIAALVRRLERPLLLGALDLPADGSGELNSAYLIQPLPETIDVAMRTQIYHKTMLLPFGEYVPGVRWLPLVGRWRTTGQFVAGEARRPNMVLSRPKSTDPQRNSQGRVTQFAPAICFEAVRPGAFNDRVRTGAQFLVNLTDDGWFGESVAPDQHLNATILRAVETRRWLVRASNSGVSAFIDPTGRIVDSLPFGAVGVLSSHIRVSTAQTWYVRGGNWPIVLSASVAVLGAIARSARPALDRWYVNSVKRRSLSASGVHAQRERVRRA